MKSTYTRTLFIDNEELQKATIKIFVHDGCKYTTKTHKILDEMRYKGLTAWDIIEGGEEAEEIEKGFDASNADEYHEYLVLHFNDGTTATFKNSHVDMFIH